MCDAIAKQWREGGAEVKMFQIMGQDSFEEKSAQEALHLKHVRDGLHRTLLIFPREGSRKTIEVPRDLARHVEVVDTYHDAAKFSSTKARAALSKGEETEGVHASVVEVIKSLGLYQRVRCSPDHLLILIIGGPAIGKGMFLSLQLCFIPQEHWQRSLQTSIRRPAFPLASSTAAALSVSLVLLSTSRRTAQRQVFAVHRQGEEQHRQVGCVLVRHHKAVSSGVHQANEEQPFLHRRL